MSRTRRRLRLTDERANHGARITEEHDDEIHADDARPAGRVDHCRIGNWPPEDFKAHIGFMMDFNKELSEAGELVGAEGLAGPEAARIVRAGKSGAPEVTDGPFAEAKEFLAGYWIVDVESPERAYAIAARGVGRARARAASR